MAGGLEGICNGIDTQEWSPFCDKYLDVKYDANSLEEGKAIAKETLQAELGLEVRQIYLKSSPASDQCCVFRSSWT